MKNLLRYTLLPVGIATFLAGGLIVKCTTHIQPIAPVVETRIGYKPGDDPCLKHMQEPGYTLKSCRASEKEADEQHELYMMGIWLRYNRGY